MLLFFILSMGAAARADTFTDAGGRTIAIPAKVGKVAAAGPPAEALIYMLAPEKLAGWVKAKSDTEKDLLLTTVARLPVLGRLTGKSSDAAIAAIRKARPDLIIDVGDVDPPHVALANRVQKETGIPYVLIDGHLSKTQDALRQVGDLLDVTDRADKLATYADQLFDDMSTALDLMPKKDRPRIYYGRGPNGLQTGLSGSINTEIIDALGAVNVAAEGGKGGLATVTVQQVVAWNPDIILAGDPAFFASVKTDPAWASVKAVRTGRVYRAPDKPFGWIDEPPGPNRLMGFMWLEGILYPKRFDKDVMAETRDFYDEFYQVDLWDEELDELFEGTSLQQH
jgi:iron complex transport system substrate-binding protein